MDPYSADAPHLFQIVASDTTVFQDYTKQYYNIDDKQIIRLFLKDKFSSHTLREVKEERVQVRLPPGVDHYYIMEMLD
jgi:glutamine---fructose-6-phosphate transaminase (isomerizing)